MRALGRNLPSSGGGYFRLLPYALSRWMRRLTFDMASDPVNEYLQFFRIGVHCTSVIFLVLK